MCFVIKGLTTRNALQRHNSQNIIHCVECDHCTVIDKVAHADRICRPCTFDDVFLKRGQGKCAQASCLLKLKYGIHEFDGSGNGGQVECASDTQQYLDFASGIQQNRVGAFYAGGLWKKLWVEGNVASFKSNTFKCTDVPWQGAAHIKWMPFSQYAIETHTIRLSGIVTVLRSATIDSQMSAIYLNDEFEAALTPQQNSFSYSVNVAPLDEVIQRYGVLSARLKTNHIQAAQLPGYHIVTAQHEVLILARILEIKFFMLPLHEIAVHTLTLTFETPDSSNTLVLSIDQNMTSWRNTLQITSDPIAGSLANATLDAAVAENTKFLLLIHDTMADTVLRSTIMLQPTVAKAAVECNAGAQQSKYQITNPMEFDMLRTAYRDTMCTSSFGV